MKHHDRAQFFANLEQASLSGSRKEKSAALRTLRAERLKDLRTAAARQRQLHSQLRLIWS